MMSRVAVRVLPDRPAKPSMDRVRRELGSHRCGKPVRRNDGALVGLGFRRLHSSSRGGGP